LLPKKIDKSLLEFSFQEEKGMAAALPVLGGKVIASSLQSSNTFQKHSNVLTETGRTRCVIKD
jgi:hypothetical protein